MEGNKVARQKSVGLFFCLISSQSAIPLSSPHIHPSVHPSISVPPLLIYSEWQCVGREGHPVGDCHTHTAIITSAVQQKTSHHLRLTSPSSSFFILINFYFCLHVPPSSSTSTSSSSSSPSPSSALYFLIFFIIIIIFLPEYFHVMLHNTFAPKNPPR